MEYDLWSQPYSVGEIVWGMVLLVGIFAVNIGVLCVVGQSRELWKPRHLWMACLCITDLFVGTHKGLELLLLIAPQRELCVLQRATLGIPYVVNMLLLTLLSLDRFVAVRYPFFYSSSISNKHVVIGFLIVLVGGSSLAAASVTLGLRDPICRAQSLQLVYLTIVLTICSILTLLFNSSVLRIAKKQLNAIYAHEPTLGGRRVSVVCTNCGYKNETFVNSILPVASTGTNSSPVPLMTSEALENNSPLKTLGVANVLPALTDAIVMGPVDMQDLEADVNRYHPDMSNISEQLIIPNFNNININMNLANVTNTTMHFGGSDGSSTMDETTTPLVRTLSLPTIPDSLTVPISVVVQPDPSVQPAVVVANVTADLANGKAPSLSQLDSFGQSHIPVGGGHTLPRSRSLVTCRSHPIMPPSHQNHVPRLQLFRNLHFARTHMFHVGRLFPSIRFARTVLLIMIPMWVFILPIVTIIPLHRGCEDGNKSELDCELVGTLWRYLVIHMRSVLPLQAILDTMIYACGSKEFRQSLMKILKRFRSPK